MNGGEFSSSLPVNNVADVLTQVKQISEGKDKKPLVICAKAKSPHVQVKKLKKFTVENTQKIQKVFTKNKKN